LGAQSRSASPASVDVNLGVRAELARLAGAGCTDVVLSPCSGDLDQVDRLSQALGDSVPGFQDLPIDAGSVNWP
jgi:hypothetical protein